MNLSPPRGTRDFYPDDFRLRDWLFTHFREASRAFAFEEYDSPVVESEELYVRKAGEQIVDELYAFEDKGGRRLALRPEMTPSIARLVLARAGSLALPLKWFSIPQCWRYERIQRGRRREHFQWNVDIFGIPDVAAEAELLCLLTTLFSRLGLTAEDVEIRLSSRKIIEAVLDAASVPEGRFSEVCVLVDKLDKLPAAAVREDLEGLGLDASVVDTLLELTTVDSLEGAAELIGEESGGIGDLRRLLALAAGYGIADWVRFDAGLVRGLAYYTGVVFEVFDRASELRAICGGGRYDRLLSTFGGRDIPACGFGFGDAVIVELLSEKGLLPELPRRFDDVVFPFSAELRPAAMEVADRLRRAGRSVDLVLEERRMKWAFRHADSCGASRLVLVAPDEWERGLVKVRDLETGEEREVAAGEVAGLHAGSGP